ncbi:TetR family transcriptional regulator C-terminal domain-containing protein [Nonomuraea spiralis]|uniref:TetR family transcriptional regulator C-terminal domain-containing protein n=1 Tax=Nonomuraea spiralis TaxID=46182 RepID=UPI0037AA41ED
MTRMPPGAGMEAVVGSKTSCHQVSFHQRDVPATNLGAGVPAARAAAERLELAARLLGELLPLDAPRRAEVTVFLDFAAASRTDPALRDLAGRAAVGTREFVGLVLARLGSGGVLRPGLRLDVETERLSSLVGGLGVNAVLRPELVSGDDCLEVVRAHLGSLAA